MPGDPGGVIGGDVHVTKKDGTVFDFDGELYKLSKIYQSDSIQVNGRFFPVPGEGSGSPRTYFGGIDVHTAGPTQIYIDTFGNVNIFSGGNHWKIQAKVDTLDAIGHPGCTSIEHHPLQGVPHLNAFFKSCPENPGQESGIMIDGDRPDATPSDYLVE